jgi:nucleoside-diphosphate-sugar epimerase
MSGRVVVLGAAGRLGRAAAEAFRDAGWSVASMVRARAASRAAANTDIVEADARDPGSVIEAARGADIVLHALNAPYTSWPKLAIPYAKASIAAAKQAGATLMLPGNLYNYGSPLPPDLDESTPMRPLSRKGRLRVVIEEGMQAAAGDGVRVVIIRTGDFFGGPSLGSWFDRVIVRDIANARVTYPGPLDVVHEWAYVQDVAAAFVKVAAARDKLAAFESLGFSGHAVTGRELVAAIARVLGRNMKVARMPWLALKLLAPAVPIFRELAELAYLWNEPHRIVGAKLKKFIGDVPHTPFDAAVAAALDDLGLIAPHMAARR